MFLSDELERAEAAFDSARATGAADQRWVAGLEQDEPVLVALETSRVAYKVGNSATTFGVILAVFERHLGELAAAPLETVFGVREVPVETAAAIRAAIDRLVCEGSMPENAPWRALEVLAAGEPQYSSCRAWSSGVRRRDRVELMRRVGEP